MLGKCKKRNLLRSFFFVCLWLSDANSMFSFELQIILDGNLYEESSIASVSDGFLTTDFPNSHILVCQVRIVIHNFVSQLKDMVYTFSIVVESIMDTNSPPGTYLSQFLLAQIEQIFRNIPFKHFNTSKIFLKMNKLKMQTRGLQTQTYLVYISII